MIRYRLIVHSIYELYYEDGNDDSTTSYWFTEYGRFFVASQDIYLHQKVW